MSEIAKIDKTVKKETVYIFAVTVILSALMQAVFLVIGKWDYTVLLGNLLSAFAAVLNFFLMGIGVQKAVTKSEKAAADTMRLSQTLRMMMLLGFAVLGVVLNCFNTVAVIIPLFFPRAAVSLRPVLGKKTDNNSGRE